MPTFTPPTRTEAWGTTGLWRYFDMQVGESVVKVDGTFQTVPYPTDGELDGLTPGVDFFLGGYTYQVSDQIAGELVSAGYLIGDGDGLDLGYGEGGYGEGGYGL